MVSIKPTIMEATSAPRIEPMPPMMIYMLMAAVLVFRPEGLFPASSK